MEKLEAFLSKWLLPIAAKLEQNPQMAAIRRAMMTLVPVTLIGSLPTMFTQLSGFTNLPAFLTAAIGYMAKITAPLAFPTMGCLGVYVAIFIGYYYSEERKVWNIGAMVTALASFLAVATLTTEAGATDVSYYGGSGIFTAIVVGLFSVEILSIFRNKLNFTINLGEGVPTPIKRSFENLWPILFSLLIIATLKLIIESVTGVAVVKLVEALFAPLTASVNTLPGILFILFMTQLLWWFGIHGYAVMAPVWLAVAFANVETNAVFAAGTSSTFMVVTPDFFWNLAGVTGSGITGALCFLMATSKAKQYKAIGRISIVPAFFGIGESVIFGIPVMLNPVMFIPWLLSAPIAAIIGWVAISSGFMKPFSLVSPYLPIPFGALIACMDWKYLIVLALILVSAVLIYLPFFKICEKQAIEAEESASKDTRTLEDVDLDF